MLRFSPLRLGAVETVYAMTIHKSQGSQFDTVAVLLPAPSSRILTRELLYTAVTRARRRADPDRHRGGRASRGRPPGRAGLGTRREAVRRRSGIKTHFHYRKQVAFETVALDKDLKAD